MKWMKNIGSITNWEERDHTLIRGFLVANRVKIKRVMPISRKSPFCVLHLRYLYDAISCLNFFFL